jgi:colicin import membrane protein
MTRVAEEVRARRDRAQAEETAKKRDLDRLAADVTSKSAAAKTAQATGEKIAREAQEARQKAEEQLLVAQQRLAELKAAREKQLADLGSKVNAAEQARKQAEKEMNDLWTEVQQLARDRDQLKTASLSANGQADRAAADAASRRRTFQSAEMQVMQQLERKLAAEKLLADTKSAIEKRARAQFK